MRLSSLIPCRAAVATSFTAVTLGLVPVASQLVSSGATGSHASISPTASLASSVSDPNAIEVHAVFPQDAQSPRFVNSGGAGRDVNARLAGAARADAADLSFPGGRVDEFLEALRAVAPELDVVVAQGAEELMVPAMHLKRVTSEEALQLLTKVMIDYPVRVAALPTADGRERWIVSAWRNPDGGDDANRTVFLADSLTPIVKAGTMEVQAVLGSIEAAVAVALGDEAERVTLQYHEGTGVLLASGPARGLAAVREVLGVLRNESRTPNLTAQVALQVEKRNELQALLEQATQRAVEAETKADMLERALDQERNAALARRDEAEVQALEFARRSVAIEDLERRLAGAQGETSSALQRFHQSEARIQGLEQQVRQSIKRGDEAMEENQKLRAELSTLQREQKQTDNKGS